MAFANDFTCYGKSTGHGYLYAERAQAITGAPYLGEDRTQLAHDRGASLDQTSYRPFHTKRFIGASFSKSIRKSLGGWRILTRGRTLTLDPDSSGNVVVHGLQGKPLRSLRVNGVSTLYLRRLDQIDALSWQWIDYHENIVEQVWAHTAGSIPTQTITGCEGMIPCEASKSLSKDLLFDA